MSFVIGIEKMIEVTLGIPLQRKIKVYPQKKESLNINPPSYPPIVYVGCGVAWYLVVIFNEGHSS